MISPLSGLKHLVRKAVVVKKGWCHISHSGKNVRVRWGPKETNEIMAFTDRETEKVNRKRCYLIIIPI